MPTFFVAPIVPTGAFACTFAARSNKVAEGTGGSWTCACTAFGPYVLADGQVPIPQAGLDAAMAPDVNGVDLVFGLAVQAHVQDPPVPSATLFDLAANVHAKAPVGTIGATKNVGILLDPGHFPRSNVAVALTSGDPIAPKLNLYMAEYLHQKYEADGPTFPHTVSKLDQPVLAFGFQAY